MQYDSGGGSSECSSYGGTPIPFAEYNPSLRLVSVDCAVEDVI